MISANISAMFEECSRGWLFFQRFYMYNAIFRTRNSSVVTAVISVCVSIRLKYTLRSLLSCVYPFILDVCKDSPGLFVLHHVFRICLALLFRVYLCFVEFHQR